MFASREPLNALPALNQPRLSSVELAKLPVDEIYLKIVEAAAWKVCSFVIKRIQVPALGYGCLSLEGAL